MSIENMWAIRVHRYGGPEQLQLEQIERPTPQAGEVLVRVYAAGVNPVDWRIRNGSLKDFRPASFPYIPGVDIAGIVEEIGPGVTTFQQGQAVFGQARQGAYAEYTIASVAQLSPKPERLSFDEAATLPAGAITAWQGLFDHGHLEAGQRVLVQGAAGGVGLLAVQLARWKGAQVIGTASRSNVDFVSSLGAEVVDYTATPIEKVVHDVDLVFDTVGEETLNSSVEVLKRGGTLVTIVAIPSQERAQERGIRTAWFSAQTSSSSELLRTFARLIDEGHLKTSVVTRYPLHSANHAHQQSQSGHGRGRIVLHIAD